MSSNGVKVDPQAAKRDDPINKMAPTEARAFDIRRESENREQIMEAGQDDHKKGVEETIRQIKAEQKISLEKKNERLDILDRKKKTQFGYRRQLASYLVQTLETLEWLPNWDCEVLITDGTPVTIYGKHFQTKSGVLMIVKTPRGHVLHQGMLITGEPVLDLAGCVTLALQCENSLDDARGLLTDSLKADPDTIIDKHGNNISTPR